MQQDDMTFDSHPRVYQIEGNDLEMIKSWFKLLGEEVYSLRIMPGEGGVQVRFNDRDWSPSLGHVEANGRG
jgi:hypothetical protein